MGRLSVIHIDPPLGSFPPLIFKWWRLHSFRCTFTRKQVDAWLRGVRAVLVFAGSGSLTGIGSILASAASL